MDDWLIWLIAAAALGADEIFTLTAALGVLAAKASPGSPRSACS